MDKSEIKNLSHQIKKKILETGFDICGIAKARALTEREPVIRKWLEAGMNDKMGYLAREPEKRFNPELVFPGTKSLVVAGMSYYSEIMQKSRGDPVLSRYTYGRDYHTVIVPKLEKTLEYIKKMIPEADGRAFCDTGFFHEKSWIREAGLGWQGRHSIAINGEIGSFFFIGILMLNIELDYDEPFKDEKCGSCRICIDKCPTGAINENRTIDARKCISNRTIENRGPVPEEIIPKLGGRVYGCDLCQEVCPWNKNIEPNSHPEFAGNDKVMNMTREDWESLTEDQYREYFGNTALVRIKFPDFKRNIEAAFRSMRS